MVTINKLHFANNLYIADSSLKDKQFYDSDHKPSYESQSQTSYKLKISNFIKDIKQKLTPKPSDISYLKILKVFIDTYSLSVASVGLLSLVLPEYIATPIGLIIGTSPLILKENSIFKKIKDKVSSFAYPIVEKIGKAFNYIPFKYPSILANQEQKKQIISTLDELPLKIVNNLSIIEINNEINDKYDAVGLVIDKIYKTPIYLHSNPYPYTLKEVLIHEIGHTVDFGFKLFPLNYKSTFLAIIPKYPWGIKNFVSSYAQSDSREDFAESLTYFFMDPKKLYQTSPYKYHFIKNTITQNFIEKTFDNKFFRTIGKKISQIMSSFPVIRNLLDISSFYTSHKMISEGIEKMEKSKKENDKNLLIDSKFTLLSGILIAKKSIYSLPLLPIKFFANKILNNQKIKNKDNYEKILDFIDKGLSISLSLSIGPIGTALYQALQSDLNPKNKFLVLLSGLTTSLSFTVLKLTFPPLIGILSVLQTLSTLTLTELVKKHLSNNN